MAEPSGLSDKKQKAKERRESQWTWGVVRDVGQSRSPSEEGKCGGGKLKMPSGSPTGRAY